jgi:hypothetical protein
VYLERVTIDGNLTVHSTTPSPTQVIRATIGGNALLSGNADLDINFTRFNGWLDCSGNTFATGSSITAKGGKRGQCANL